MKLEDKYSTIEQSKRLKELGVVQGKSERYWYAGDTGNNINHLNITGSFYKNDDLSFSAFDVTELGVMLPNGYVSWFDGKHWHCSQYADDCHCVGMTEAQARAAELITAIESGEVKVDEVNKRLTE